MTNTEIATEFFQILDEYLDAKLRVCILENAEDLLHLYKTRDICMERITKLLERYQR